MHFYLAKAGRYYGAPKEEEEEEEVQIAALNYWFFMVLFQAWLRRVGKAKGMPKKHVKRQKVK